MGDISPVLASFLSGQGSQQDLIKTAQQILSQRELQKQKKIENDQRQQEIDNQLKHFDLQSKQADAAHSLQQEIFNLHNKQAHTQAFNDIRERLRNGEIPLQGTTTNMPGLTADKDTSSFQPNPVQQVDTGDQGFGMMGVPTPKLAIQSAREQQEAMMPGILELFRQQHKITESSDINKLETRMTMQSEMAKELQKMRDEQSQRGIDSKIQMAELRQQLGFQQSMAAMFGPGVTNPTDAADIIRRTAVQRGLGKIDNNQIPAHLLPAVNTFAQKNNIIEPNGGTKFRGELTDAAGGAARLLNDFDELDKKYPAGVNFMGRMGNKLTSGNYPIIGPVTDSGQEFKTYGSNIAAYASVTGETPGMMRSPVLAQKAEAAAPLPGDTPEVRNAKRIKTIDLTFAKIQRKVGGLSTDQRVEFWKDAINEMPNLKSDYKLKNILEDLLRTGTYNPAKLNGLK